MHTASIAPQPSLPYSGHSRLAVNTSSRTQQPRKTSAERWPPAATPPQPQVISVQSHETGLDLRSCQCPNGCGYVIMHAYVHTESHKQDRPFCHAATDTAEVVGSLCLELVLIAVGYPMYTMSRTSAQRVTALKASPHTLHNIQQCVIVDPSTGASAEQEGYIYKKNTLACTCLCARRHYPTRCARERQRRAMSLLPYSPRPPWPWRAAAAPVAMHGHAPVSAAGHHSPLAKAEKRPSGTCSDEVRHAKKDNRAQD